MNSKAGTPHSHTRSQPRGITTTPSKPRVRNPYQKSLDENQSSQPIAAARTPRSVTRLTSTSTPLTTALINPYAKSTSYASRAVSKIDPSCDSLKRNLGFADEDTGPQPSKKISPTRSSRNIGGSSDVINRISIDKSKTYTLYFDGGSRGNPGIAGAGMAIYDDGNLEIWSGKQFLGDGKTNNVAEYNGLVTGLECAVRLGIEKLRVRGDSDLVIKQVTGDWQCHKQHLKVLLQRALDERRKFKEFGIAHVKRDNNKRADQLANAAMNERVTNLGFAPAPSLGTPNLSQESDIVDICAKQQPTQTMTCNTFDDQDLDLKLSFLQMPTSPHKEVAAVNSSAAAQVGNVVRCCGTFDDEPLEEELMTFQIPDTVQKEIPDNGWLSGLSFLARFEVERFGLQHNQSLKDAISNIDITNTNDAISAIYNEIKSPDNSAASSSPTYNHFLKHCLANELKVDEGNSCLFLFHAKFTSKGLELLPPEPADVKTRRIHRRFGSHRFLDLHIDEKWKLPTLKDNMKKIFTDNKVIIAGRRYAILYSNTYEMPVIFRLFAESGVGIENDVSVTEVASCCIPPALNPQLSLTKYMKRMQLNFTGSIPSLVLAEGELEAIDDICGFDDNIMTDGCGLISSEALDQVWITYCDNLEQRKRDLGRSVQSECIRRPTSFQGRIGGIKGMFVLDSSLEGVKVQYRPSQLKYNTSLSTGDKESNDDSMQNTIDVIEWDKLPFHSYLNRTFIQLLEQRGVPQDYFLSLARKEVDELVKVSKSYDLLLDRYQARASSPENASMFDDDLLLGMLHARVPLDEPVMLSEVNKFISDELAVFKEKSKFPIVESRYLRMLPDHTGLLESNEAYVALGIEVGRLGEILAIRNPCYFLSDIRKLKVVSKAELSRRCKTRCKFFDDIYVGLVLSTKGNISEAELMNGGDFDGDTAWCCWNEELVSSIHGCPERNQTAVTVADPWKERVIDFNNADWTNIVITYTMHHRRDKMILGTIVNTLGNIRDDPSISPNEAEILAGKAFVQVDNPHTSQWTDHDSEAFRYSSIPHWRGSKNNGNIYTSKRVLGLLFDMLSEASGKKFDYAEIEAEMNIHIRQVIEKAEQKDAAYVNIIREEMLKRLDCFNKTVKAICESKDDSDVQKRVRNKAIKDLYRQHYSEIKNEYKDNAFDAFAILYEQTYLKSRERMRRFKKTPYVFAWNVGPDHLLRIIADGNSGEELSRSMARDNYRVLKRQRNTMIS